MTSYTNSYLEGLDFPFHIEAFKMSDGMIVEPHDHEFIELVYIYGGRGTHHYSGSLYPIQEGDVFVIQPSTKHGYQVNQDEYLLGFNVLFQPSLLTQEFETLSKVSSFVDFFYIEPFLRQSADFQSHLVLDPYERMEVKFILDRLQREYNDKDAAYRVLIKTFLIELFVFLSRCYVKKMHRPTLPASNNKDMMRKVCEFIELHHATPLSLDQISQICSMSVSNFKHKFKLYSGKTFVDFRTEVRLKMAIALLKKNDEKIITIAHQVGFEDLSSFNKAFKKLFHCSPKEYKASSLNEMSGFRNTEY